MICTPESSYMSLLLLLLPNCQGFICGCVLVWPEPMRKQLHLHRAPTPPVRICIASSEYCNGLMLSGVHVQLSRLQRRGPSQQR